MSAGYLEFLKEFTKSFTEIGSMFPSSKALARVMARPVLEAKTPVNILEVGPGTGPVTKQILKLMGTKDSLTICEINPKFVQLLKKNLASNKDYLKHKSRVTIIQAPVQDLLKKEGQGKFDVIISSLPFANFGPDLVQDILDSYRKMITEDGQVVFFQYIGIKKIVRLFASKGTKKRLSGVERVIDSWCNSKDAKIEKEISFFNIPPACSYRFVKDQPVIAKES